MKDNELDRLFKGKLHSREFEFNPSNWEAMEAMLDKDKKSLGFFWWSSAAILVFGALVMGAVWLKPAPVSNVVQDENKIIERIGNTPQEDQQELKSPTREFEEPATEEPAESTIVTHEGGSSSNEDVNQLKKETPSAPVEVNQNIADNTPAEGEANAQQWASAQASTSREAFEPIEQLSSRPITNVAAQAAGVTEDNTYRAYDEGPYLMEPAPLPKIDPAALVKFESTHEIWGQAGPDFTRSFDDGSLATGWLFGINYSYRFAQRWSFEAGLNYNARTATGITLSSDSVFYNFGQEVIRTDVRHQRLDYFEMPIGANFSINPQHQIGVGAYASALFNVNREVQRTRYPFKGNVEITTEKENGLSPNFNTLDYGFTGSYFYRYNPQLSLGLQFKYGLTDITPNRTELLSPFHRNANTRVIIRYRLY